MTWYTIAGLCSIISGVLANIEGAIGHDMGIWLVVIGAVLTVVDRFAISMERTATIKTKGKV
jgi:hypothetical protein